MEKLFQLLSDVLSEEHWRSVVRSRELIDQLPPRECRFNPYLISRSSSGVPSLLEINKEDDYDDGVSDPSSISTSDSCLCYIFQLMGYIHESEMRIDEFFLELKVVGVDATLNPASCSSISCFWSSAILS
jgi:hypothetical protein